MCVPCAMKMGRLTERESVKLPTARVVNADFFSVLFTLANIISMHQMQALGLRCLETKLRTDFKRIPKPMITINIGSIFCVWFVVLKKLDFLHDRLLLLSLTSGCQDEFFLFHFINRCAINSKRTYTMHTIQYNEYEPNEGLDRN